MVQNALHKMLQDIAEGDSSQLSEVCQKLAGWLLYVLVKETAEQDNLISMTIVRQGEGSDSPVPIFTSERYIRNWKELYEKEGTVTSFLGADICDALKHEPIVIIDPETSHYLEINSAVLSKIASLDS